MPVAVVLRHAGQRPTALPEHALRVLTELLMQLSAASSDDARVFVLAATNRVEDLDPALLRRFDRCLEVSLACWFSTAPASRSPFSSMGHPSPRVPGKYA